MVPLAHSGHWLVNLIYVAPVLLVVAWIGINSIRDRRRERAGRRITSSERHS